MEITATGLPCRSNQVLYYCPPNPTQNVIYFQGDTQVCMYNTSIQSVPHIFHFSNRIYEDTWRLNMKRLVVGRTGVLTIRVPFFKPSSQGVVSGLFVHVQCCGTCLVVFITLFLVQLLVGM